MEIVRKSLRAIVYGVRHLGSELRLLRYRCLYAGFRAGKGVHLSQGVYVNVVRGGTLTLGSRVHVEPYCHLTAEGSICIGDRGYIGQGTVIVASERVEIGSDALIAAYVTIRDQDHITENSHISYNRQGLIARAVRIADNVWIGTKATILKGVTIERNAIIGANSVVTGTVAADTIVVGIPAKLLRARADESGNVLT